MNIISALWHLQTIDQEIENQTKHLHQVEQALANDPAVVTARSADETERKKLDELRRALNDRELEAKSVDSKIKELNDRLYSGRVANPKELDGLSKDLDMHKRIRSTLDDKLLELMDSIEQANARVNEKSNALKHIESKRATDLEHLTQERDALTHRLADRATERERLRGALNADALRTYDKLRPAKANRALAQLKRGACGACGVSIPTGQVQRVQAGEEIIFCSSCGRILAP